MGLQNSKAVIWCIESFVSFRAILAQPSFGLTSFCTMCYHNVFDKKLLTSLKAASTVVAPKTPDKVFTRVGNLFSDCWGETSEQKCPCRDQNQIFFTKPCPYTSWQMGQLVLNFSPYFGSARLRNFIMPGSISWFHLIAERMI